MEIYKITNLLNNKVYIGKDTKSNKNYYGSGVLIKRAIKKHGLENFKKEILEECETNEELCTKEKYWINHYNSTNLNLGYNISKGGDGGDTITNNPNLESIKVKISSFRKGRKYEDFLTKEKALEYKEKLSKHIGQRLKGKTYIQMYGVEKANEIKLKQSKTRLENLSKKILIQKVKLTKEEIEDRKLKKLKEKYSNINEIEYLKKIYSGYKKRNNLNYFKDIIGDEKFNKIVEIINKPYKHSIETIQNIKNRKIKIFLNEKNKLINFLKNDQNKTRNDYYNNLTNKQISTKIKKFLHGKLSYLLTDEEKKLIKKTPKRDIKLSKETLTSIKTKLGKPVIIDNVEFISVSDASIILNLDRGLLRYRLKNKNYPNYVYKYEK